MVATKNPEVARQPWTQAEVRFSEDFAEQFQLYRLFDFREAPRMFALTGAVSANCRLDPRNYSASLL